MPSLNSSRGCVHCPCPIAWLGFVILTFWLHFPCLSYLNSLSALSLYAFRLLLFFYSLFEYSYPRAVAERVSRT
ncbi:hypothetical protein EV401DRAFT_1097968 [Pisolithus croceorrhizus]|nr:hypothetical protein EV401DRAFT_1097968 [Pisolithus croceorrhizus]